VGTTAALTYTAAMTGLYQVWYKPYPRSSFHYFNDNNEWLQMDKIGHGYSAWLEGYYGMKLMQWAGLSQRKAAIYGGTWGLLMQTPVEVMDGFSSEWGFSWGDMAANLSGSILLAGQELLFRDQILQARFSFWPSKYAKQNPALLGSSLPQEFIKDYNGQTYWLSTGLYRFAPGRNIPKWLNIAFGMGAEGMLRGTYKDQINDLRFSGIERKRQFLFSLDLDMNKIPTHSKLLKTLLSIAAVLKTPAPAIEVDSRGEWHFYWLYF
jgi:uncharacterized protein YfiM (DUF2279 family)